MIKALIFDLDGTLLDTSEGVVECARYAASELGQPLLPREELLDFIGPPLTDSFPKHYGFDEETTREAIRLFRQHYREGAVYKAKPYEGIFTLCDALHARGTFMAVATNKLEPMAQRLLDHFGFAVIAHKILSADSQDLDLRIGRQLFENILKCAASEIHHVVDQHLKAEGTAFGLIAVCRQKVEDLSLVEKLMYLFRICHHYIPPWSDV